MVVLAVQPAVGSVLVIVQVWQGVHASRSELLKKSVIQIVVIRFSCLLKHVSDFRSVFWFVCPVDLARLSFTKVRVNAEDP